MKTRKIIYWIFTLWMSLGMVSTGIVQIFQQKTAPTFITGLGYPSYFLAFLGVCKILGVVAALMPGRPLVKEYAYAGFIFLMTGAIFSHIAHGDVFGEMFPSILLLVITLLSWSFRPSDRRVAFAHA